MISYPDAVRHFCRDFLFFPYAKVGKDVDNPNEVDVLLVGGQQAPFSRLVEDHILVESSHAVVLRV